MKRLHLFIGVLATLAFVLSGQSMHFHKPQLASLPDDVHLMYVSRHIYLAAATMVNVCLGLYLTEHRSTWRRMLQRLGSLMVLFSPIFLLLAFVYEPSLGMAGRSWRTAIGLIPMIIGVGLHFVASVGAKADLAAN
jgi:hypothetical protein